jgi:chromosome segregation ATPase
MLEADHQGVLQQLRAVDARAAELSEIAASEAALKADLTERYMRIELDHVGLAERHGKVVAEHTALVERHLMLEADHQGVLQQLRAVDARAAELSEIAASEAALKADLTEREEELREVGSRIALLEQEFCVLTEQYSKATDEYERRLREVVVRLADQASEGLLMSERHAAERVTLSERLITAEIENARFAALAEHHQRLLSESQAAADALELDLAMERERSGSLYRDVERAQQELSGLFGTVATQAGALEEAFRREGALNDEIAELRAAYAVVENEVRVAEAHRDELDTAYRRITDDREQLRVAVADRTAERNAAYDRLREAKAESAALIQQIGNILLDVQSQGALVVSESELDALRQHVAAIRKSTSWKVTAPLRGIARLFGRGRK